jgi:phage portal protein BeeE
MARKLRLWGWRRGDDDPPERSISVSDWAEMFTFNGAAYGVLNVNQTLPGSKVEQVAEDFRGYAEGLYKRNGIVFACMAVRMLLFAEARFVFRRLGTGTPGELVGSQDLRILEKPWPNGTTGDLLARAMQDVDLAGNFYGYLDKSRSAQPWGTIRRMRPDWVEIILGSETDDSVGYGDLGCEIIGYRYYPGGVGSQNDPVTLFRDEVAHFSPIPDPTAAYRGMSWLTPVIREIQGDGAANEHKLKFFENGATPNMVVKVPASKVEEFNKWVDRYRQGHEGLANAYRTVYLGAGADAAVVGADFRQMDFKVVQGHGETRVAAAAQVPPIIVGLSEGLEAATYSNYQLARRRFSDGTMRPLWRNLCSSFTPLVNVLPRTELWYDDRDIPFLAEDAKDQAEVIRMKSEAISNLTTAGYDPSSSVEAVEAGDLTRLSHSGLYSVQLRPPGSTEPQPPELPAPVQNGNGSPPAPAQNGAPPRHAGIAALLERN